MRYSDYPPVSLLTKRFVSTSPCHRRENRAVAPLDPRVHITRRIEQCMAKNEMLELELITEYSKELGMRPEASVADKMKQTWNEVGAFRRTSYFNHGCFCCHDGYTGFGSCVSLALRPS